MSEENKLVHIYSGTQLLVNYLKEELNENAITSLIQNDFQSGISAGFGGGTSSAVDLFIQEIDMEKAEPIVKEFINNNE